MTIRTPICRVNLLACVAALCLEACATAPKLASSEIPAALLPKFRSCQPMNGAGGLQLYDGEAFLGSAEFEWLSQDNGDWEFNILGPLGNTLLSLKLLNTILTVGGPLAERMPPIEVDTTSGFLLVNGYRAGFRVGEIPCLAGFVLPRSWLSDLVMSAAEKNSQKLRFVEDERDITADIAGMGHADLWSSTCVSLVDTRRWTLGTQTLRWCFEDVPRKSAVLSGLLNYSLRWTSYEHH